MLYEIPMFYDFIGLPFARFWVYSLILGKNPEFFSLFYVTFEDNFQEPKVIHL